MAEKTKKNAHLWERHPEDYYIEPYWCSRLLFENEIFQGWIHDPACGQGRIVSEARRAMNSVSYSDIIIRDRIEALEWEPSPKACNFLNSQTERVNIVSNPPFGLCLKPPHSFVRKALEVATNKVAFLLPLTFMSGEKRVRFLKKTPLARIWVLAPRPSMPPGPVIEAGIEPGGGQKDFAWFVWDKGMGRTGGRVEVDWLIRGEDESEE